MADLVLARDATDVFALGGNFHAQSSTLNHTHKTLDKDGADGDSVCEATPFGGQTEVSVPYEFCGASMGTALAAALENGELKGGYIVTTIAITTSPDAGPQITLTGHNHDSNAHAATPALQTFAIPAAQITLLDSITDHGVVDFLAKKDLVTNITVPTASTWTFSLTHTDEDNDLGEHAVGENSKGKIDSTCDYIGTPTDFTVASPWVRDSYDTGDDNNTGDTTSISAHQFVTRT